MKIADKTKNQPYFIDSLQQNLSVVPVVTCAVSLNAMNN